MNADGSDVRRLTDEPGYDGGAFFSADGTRSSTAAPPRRPPEDSPTSAGSSPAT
jgi:hypothetical protein